MKKASVVLWVGLAFFSLSLIIYLVRIASVIDNYHALIPTLSSNDQNHFSFAFMIELFAYVFFGAPALLSELSCTRSIYKILRHNPHGGVKVCYIISAVVALAAFIFQCLIFFAIIVIPPLNGSVALLDYVLLFTTWPPFLLSFVLGSVSSKRVGDTVDRNSALSTVSN